MSSADVAAPSLSYRERTPCADLLAASAPRPAVLATGWVRTKREAKGFAFLELNDGSGLANLQVIVDETATGYTQLSAIGTGTAVAVRGDLVESPGQGQRYELKARALDIIGHCAPDYPLQKKRHSDEFLRSIAHLRARTNKYGALARIRSRLSFAVHTFFQARGFHYIHTPILTGSDCEGAGEMFRVTTLDPYAVTSARAATDDFFGKPAHLTVSGQLSVETYCLALSQVYTFGPTFRAENSNTARHMAEFWMIEPEIAFADLVDDMQLAEDLVRYLVDFVRTDCAADLDLFARFVDTGLDARLAAIADSRFERLSYSDAITLLQASGHAFEFAPVWGADLQTEHERFLTETYSRGRCSCTTGPVTSRRSTCARMPTAGPWRRWICWCRIPANGRGSAREERADVLSARIEALGLPLEAYWWYLDTRRFGSVPHAGFGLGFERFLMFVTGVTNIRDVIPFPRTPRHLEF